MSSDRHVLVLLTALVLSSCAVAFDVGPRPAGSGDGGSSDADPGDGGTGCLGADADFCADFEDGPVERDWNDKREEHGSIALDSTRGFGSARSAVCSPTEVSPSFKSAASLIKRLSGGRPSIVEFDAWVASPVWGNASNFALAAVEIGWSSPRPGSGYFAIVIEPGSVNVAASTPDLASVRSSRPFPYERWVHVAFDIDWNARLASLRLDGDEVVVNRFAPGGEVGSDPSTSLEIGFIGFNAPAPRGSVTLDNVVIRRR